MSEKQKAVASIIIGSFLGGIVPSFTKLGLNSIPPLNFAFIRFLIATLIILPYIVKNVSFGKLRSIIPISAFAVLNIIFFVFGIKNTTAVAAGILYSGVPVLTTLILIYLKKERINLSHSLGILVGLLGVVIIIVLPVVERGQQFSGNLLGNVLLSTGVVFWSFYQVFSKNLQKTFSPFLITSVFILITTFVLFPLAILELQYYSNWWNQLTPISIYSLLIVSIFGTIISYICFQYAIKHGGSLIASMTFYLSPVFAYLAAFGILGEKLTFGSILGSILALSGIYLVTKSKK